VQSIRGGDDIFENLAETIVTSLGRPIRLRHYVYTKKRLLEPHMTYLHTLRVHSTFFRKKKKREKKNKYMGSCARATVTAVVTPCHRRYPRGRFDTE